MARSSKSSYTGKQKRKAAKPAENGRDPGWMKVELVPAKAAE